MSGEMVFALTFAILSAMMGGFMSKVWTVIFLTWFWVAWSKDDRWQR